MVILFDLPHQYSKHSVTVTFPMLLFMINDFMRSLSCPVTKSVHYILWPAIVGDYCILRASVMQQYQWPQSTDRAIASPLFPWYRGTCLFHYFQTGTYYFALEHTITSLKLSGETTFSQMMKLLLVKWCTLNVVNDENSLDEGYNIYNKYHAFLFLYQTSKYQSW